MDKPREKPLPQRVTQRVKDLFIHEAMPAEGKPEVRGVYPDPQVADLPGRGLIVANRL